MPYRGSQYTPASHLLAAGLAGAGLLDGPLRPIVRVRFRLLERMGKLDTPIRLPAHLAEAIGEEEVPARRLAGSYRDLAAEAARRLEALASAQGRQSWQRESFPELTGQIGRLDRQRRDLARSDPKSQAIRDLWQRTKALQTDLLDRTVRQIARDQQVADVDYWDSRGALLPWSIALGGEEFYDELTNHAEIYDEPLLPEQAVG